MRSCVKRIQAILNFIPLQSVICCTHARMHVRTDTRTHSHTHTSVVLVATLTLSVSSSQFLMCPLTFTVGSDLPDVICSLKTCRIKRYLYNSMQHLSFPSLSSDKSGLRINRCRINQSPLQFSYSSHSTEDLSLQLVIVIVMVDLVVVSREKQRGLTLQCAYELHPISHAVCVFCYDVCT